MSVFSTNDSSFVYFSDYTIEETPKVEESPVYITPTNDLADYYLKSGFQNQSYTMCLQGARLHRLIDMLEHVLSLIDPSDQHLKYTILKEGIEWDIKQENDWTNWKFWDELSICAYWQKDIDTATIAYKQLIKNNKFPAEHKERIEFNSRFFVLNDFSDKIISCNKEQKTMLISIEGNIGSGKSTLLEQLKSAKFDRQHIVILEDVKEWTSFNDSKGANILEKYYQDQTKYGYCFQSLVLISRIQHLVEAIIKNPNSIIITERCPYTDLNIFARTLYDKGALEEIEWLTYNHCHQILSKISDINIDLFIYNKCSPKTCMERIEQRNRKGEQNIPSELIEDLDKRHNNWLIDCKNVYYFNGELDIQQRNTEFEKLIEFINSQI